MFGKTAWLAGALAAGLLTFSAGSALADGGHGWKHGGYHYKHHYKHYGHHDRGKYVHRHKHKRFRHHRHKHFRHKKHGHFRGHGHKHYKPFKYGGHRHFRHRGPRYYRPQGFTFVFRLGHSYDAYTGTGYGHAQSSRVILVEQSTAVVETLEHAPDNQGIVWNEPQTQAAYEVVPTETYQEPGGRYCREFLTTARVGGQVQEAYGRACRQPDGAWEIVQ